MPDALPQTGIQAPKRANFYFEEGAQTFVAPLTDKAQRLSLFGLWHVTFEWEDLEQPDAMTIISFLNKKGMSGQFSIYDPARVAIRGGGTGAVTVNGASQVGRSLITTGWGGTNPILVAGDLIAIEGKLYEVDANVNRSGAAATITLANQIYAAHANGATVGYNTAAALTVRLAKPVMPTIVPPTLYSFEAEMVQDL